MAQKSPIPPRTTTRAERGGTTRVFRSPATAHMKTLFNYTIRGIRIVRR